MSASAVLAALGELAEFGLDHGQDISDLIASFVASKPELRAPPPEPARQEIDAEVDRMIDEGEL